MQRRVERALLDAELVVGDLLEVVDYGVPVHGAAGGKSLEDQKVEGVLELVRPRFIHT
jgi:hypothetical protein